MGTLCLPLNSAMNLKLKKSCQFEKKKSALYTNVELYINWFIWFNSTIIYIYIYIYICICKIILNSNLEMVAYYISLKLP